eukprot:TRINITY_DN7768_c0_g1_i2.p1 TRINITY_DN7768_c0_g1~~TRINITY_DN7768_c0_g1_i2.p1  ORF type:complete len:369 (+),score=107.89 TRINITY_DN7768_c0_g1_i2:95-1108(+)
MPASGAHLDAAGVLGELEAQIERAEWQLRRSHTQQQQQQQQQRRPRASPRPRARRSSPRQSRSPPQRPPFRVGAGRFSGRLPAGAEPWPSPPPASRRGGDGGSERRGGSPASPLSPQAAAGHCRGRSPAPRSPRAPPQAAERPAGLLALQETVAALGARIGNAELWADSLGWEEADRRSDSLQRRVCERLAALPPPQYPRFRRRGGAASPAADSALRASRPPSPPSEELPPGRAVQSPCPHGAPGSPGSGALLSPAPPERAARAGAEQPAAAAEPARATDAAWRDLQEEFAAAYAGIRRSRERLLSAAAVVHPAPRLPSPPPDPPPPPQCPSAGGGC